MLEQAHSSLNLLDVNLDPKIGKQKPHNKTCTNLRYINKDGKTAIQKSLHINLKIYIEEFKDNKIQKMWR